MNKAERITKDLFTGPDGETHDPARWLWIIGVVAFLVLTGYELYRTGHFDMTNFGIAYATLLGGGAAGVKIKESTEPRGTFNPSTFPPGFPTVTPAVTPTGFTATTPVAPTTTTTTVVSSATIPISSGPIMDPNIDPSLPPI